MLGAVALLARLMMRWPRHVGQIEAALRAHDIADLPVLAANRRTRLDRIVVALNEAGTPACGRAAPSRSAGPAGRDGRASGGDRTGGSRCRARDPQSDRRYAAQGRKRDLRRARRKDQALSMILGQIERLDALLRRLLSVTERDRPRRGIGGARPVSPSPAAPRTPNLPGQGHRHR